MSDPISKDPQTWLQGITLAILGAGGVLGKGAYEDLRMEAQETRILVARLEKSIESLEERRADLSGSIGEMRGDVRSLESRVIKLEERNRREDSQ